MKTYKQFIKEHLDDAQQKIVIDKKLNTAAIKKNFAKIIPKGRDYVEIPLQNPLDLKISNHLKNSPIYDRVGNHMGFYQRDASNPKMAIHPDGRKIKLSGVLKSNPDLLKEYSNVGSKKTEVSDDYDIKNKVGERRWTAPSLNLEHVKVILTGHPNASQGMTEGKPWASCSGWRKPTDMLRDDTDASDNLDGHVESGGGVAFLMDHDEMDHTNPTKVRGRVAIYPWHARDKNGKIIHTILRASNKRYGEDDAHESFHKTTADYLENNYPMKHNEYTLDPRVYQRDEPKSKIRMPLAPEVKDSHIKKLQSAIKDGTVNIMDINHAIENDYLSPTHITDIAKNPKLAQAHQFMAMYHRIGHIKLTPESINHITSHPNSAEAQSNIVSANNEDMLKLSPENVNNLVNNTEAKESHLGLLRGIRAGMVQLSSENIKKLKSYGHKI
jgi:hypothetical protein